MARRRQVQEIKKSKRLKEVRVRKLFLSISVDKPDDKTLISEAIHVLQTLTGQRPSIYKGHKQRGNVSLKNKDIVTIQSVLKGPKATSIFDKSLNVHQYVLKNSNFLPNGQLMYDINNHRDICAIGEHPFRLNFKVVLARPGCSKRSSPGVVGFFRNIGRIDAISWFREKFNGAVNPF